MPEITTLGSAAPGTTGTVTTAGFTIPTGSNTVTVAVADSTWIRPLSMVVFGNGWGAFAVQSVPNSTSVIVYSIAGPIAAGYGPVPGNVVPSGTPLTFGGQILPAADTAGAGLLKKLSGNTTDFVDGTNACQTLITAIDPEIWSVRLRSFNSVGNPNFEVDQINCGAALTNPPTGTKNIDRWNWLKVPAVTTNQQRLQVPNNPIVIPGTTFPITNSFYRITNQAVVSSPAATDAVALYHIVEGPNFRELVGNVHSLSILVRSSVAGLKFGLGLRDNVGGTAGFVLPSLCTIPSSGVWTLIQLPNLPVWSASGTFSTLPGVGGYIISICLMAGSSMTAPSNGAWVAGAYQGANGQSNFCANAIGSTFDIAMLQHEPGPICSTFIDKPFFQNYDECLRYYQKSYDLGVLPGSSSSPLGIVALPPNSTTIISNTGIYFKKPMAKTPTVTIYNNATGAVNSVRDILVADHTITAVTGTSANCPFYNLTSSGLTSGVTGSCYIHWVADTGW
jgi:hypothetical protein